MKKNVDYFIYNYFLYIHKFSSNRKPNRTATLGLVGLSTLNSLDWIAIFSNRYYRFEFNMIFKPIQIDPRTPLGLGVRQQRSGRAQNQTRVRTRQGRARDKGFSVATDLSSSQKKKKKRPPIIPNSDNSNCNLKT